MTTIRDYRPDDRDQVLALNAANVPEVGEMDGDKLDRFADYAPYIRVVEADGDTDTGATEIVGMLIGLTEDAPYESPNYRWFSERHPRFAYIDRVAVAESQRGKGLGPALYHDFEAWARENDRPMLCAEINVEPPNPRSLRFHEIFGFSVVAEVEPYGSPDYRVAMVTKPLD